MWLGAAAPARVFEAWKDSSELREWPDSRLGSERRCTREAVPVVTRFSGAAPSAPCAQQKEHVESWGEAVSTELRSVFSKIFIIFQLVLILYAPN